MLTYLLHRLVIITANVLTVSLYEQSTLVISQVIYQVLGIHLWVNPITLTLVVIHNHIISPATSIISLYLHIWSWSLTGHVRRSAVNHLDAAWVLTWVKVRLVSLQLKVGWVWLAWCDLDDVAWWFNIWVLRLSPNFQREVWGLIVILRCVAQHSNITYWLIIVNLVICGDETLLLWDSILAKLPCSNATCGVWKAGRILNFVNACWTLIQIISLISNFLMTLQFLVCELMGVLFGSISLRLLIFPSLLEIL
jgi:hypothetical protein